MPTICYVWSFSDLLTVWNEKAERYDVLSFFLTNKNLRLAVLRVTLTHEILIMQAFKRKMYGPNYAWIIFGEFNPTEIFADNPKLRNSVLSDCSSNELKEAANGYISTIKLDIRKDNNQTISGLVSWLVRW